MLQKVNASNVVDHHAILRILLLDNSQMLDGLIILASSAKSFGVKIMRTCEIRIDAQCLLQNLFCAFDIAFLHQDASHVYVAVSPLGISFARLRECRQRILQIALQKEPNAVIIPALPV